MNITIKAAAKINLMLDLTSVLKNGYHSIYTVMQSVSIFDTIALSITDTEKIELSCSDRTVPINESNTAFKAARYYFDYTGVKNKGINIHIKKNIPSQAGMAGGSADAAAVIKALDIMYDTKLRERELFSIGEKIGADVPFCIAGGTRLCLNKGEIMAPLPDLPECYFVITKPKQGVSTKEAYMNFDNAEWIRHPDNDGFLYAMATGDMEAVYEKAANVFEQVIETKDRVTIKAVMRNNGAKLALMTGSGSAVFGLFENEKQAEQCAEELKLNFEPVFVAKPIPQGLYNV